MKNIIAILFLLSQAAFAQVDSAAIISETQIFQKDLNHEFKDKATSPLIPGDLRKFKNHDFFPIAVSYAVVASLLFTPDSLFTPMAATGANHLR